MRQTPVDRFFLETDDDPNVDIAAIYEQSALLRGISLEQLKGLMAENVRKCFGV